MTPRRFLALALAALIAIPIAISAGSVTVAIAATATSVPTMLILDASGSMIRDAPGGGSRMDQARQAATELVQALPADQQFGLMVFGTGTGNADSDQAAGCFDVKTLFPVGKIDKAAVSTAIAGIVQSGFTPIGMAIETAAAQLPSGPATIVLVSDGVDTCAPPSSCDRAAAVRAAHPDLKIHIIGFQVDQDEAAQAELDCIAKVGGGEFVSASNTAQLTARMIIAADPTVTTDRLTSVGYNDLRVGMTLKQAQAAIPGLRVSDPTVQIVYAECDFASMRFVDGVLFDIYPTVERPTVEGLQIGDSLGRATELYGEKTTTGTGKLGDYQVFAASPGSPVGYRVYTDGTKVIRIVVCVCGPGDPSSLRTSAASGGIRTISFDGIDAVELGGTAAEVATAYPTALSVISMVQQSDDRKLSAIAADELDSFSGCVVDDGEHTRGRDRIDLTLDAGLVTSVVADGAFRTDRGVTQNSTFSEVAAAYGGASNLESPSLDQAAGRWVVSDRDGRTIHFFHVAGAASSIVMVGVYDQTTTGLFPLEPYYCATNLSR